MRPLERIRPVQLLMVLAAALPLCACSGGSTSAASRPATPTGGAVATTATTATTLATTVAPATRVAPTTTVDPGVLPQTSQLPSTADPQFLARLSDLLHAVASGNPALAAPAFFPLNAYIQVKGIYDPEHDYRTRLIPAFDQDILALHSEMAIGGTAPVLVSVTPEESAQWIVPGVEYNKGSYWRVYDTRVNFRLGGQAHYFQIASLISWRGEWYVVHLSSIR